MTIYLLFMISGAVDIVEYICVYRSGRPASRAVRAPIYGAPRADRPLSTSFACLVLVLAAQLYATHSMSLPELERTMHITFGVIMAASVTLFMWGLFAPDQAFALIGAPMLLMLGGAYMIQIGAQLDDTFMDRERQLAMLYVYLVWSGLGICVLTCLLAYFIVRCAGSRHGLAATPISDEPALAAADSSHESDNALHEEKEDEDDSDRDADGAGDEVTLFSAQAARERR